MPDEGSDSDFKYWAFISYSHADKVWGDWLHRALETYRVPKRLVGTVTPSGEPVPARVFPIFRDREELPVSASLPENINRALEQSRFLIVICSPRSAASRWVNEEINTFKRLGREGRVLALIVAGEPNASDDGGKPGFRVEDECFPPTLRYRWDHSRGELSDDRTEPIAADARPDKDGKRNARLKLLAGLLQVNYDQLRQREQERRVRQLSYLAVAAVLLLAVFAGLAAYSEAQRRRAEQATVVAKEQRRNAEFQQQKAETQEREATRQRNAALEANHRYGDQLHEASMSDYGNAIDLFDKDQWRRGIAYLARAMRYDPENRSAADLLWSEIVYGAGDRDTLPRRIFNGSNQFWSAAISPDGTALAATTGGKGFIFEVATGQQIGEPLVNEDHGDGIASFYSITFSPDGSKVVTAGGNAQQWDARTGKRVGQALFDRRGIVEATYSVDGSRILTTSQRGEDTQLWDAKTCQVLLEIPTGIRGVGTAAFRPDGREVMIRDGDGVVRFFDAVTGRPSQHAIGKPSTYDNAVHLAAYSPDGKLVIVWTVQSSATIYEVSSGKKLRELPDTGVGEAGFSADGSQILIVREDGTVEQFRTGDGYKERKNLQVTGLHGVAYSPDGTILMGICGDGTVQLWDAESSQPLRAPLRHEQAVTLARFSPDGSEIVTASKDNTLYVWRMPPGREPARLILPRGNESPQGIRYSVDGQRVVTAGDHQAQVWNAATGERLCATSWSAARLRSAAFDPGGTAFRTFDEDGGVLTWDAASGRAAGEREGHDLDRSPFVVSPDGGQILRIFGYERKARLWDTANGESLTPVMETEDYAIAHVAFSGRGNRLFFASKGGVGQLWDVATGMPAGPARGFGDQIAGVALNADGTRALIADRQHVLRQWDLASGEPVGAPLLQSRQIVGAIYSPEATRIAVVDSGNGVQVFDAASGQPISARWSHDCRINELVFSPDARRLAIASECMSACFVELVELRDPPPVTLLNKCAEVLSGYRFAGNGNLVELPADERLRLYQLCKRRLRKLRPEQAGEWTRLFQWALDKTPDRPIVPGCRVTLREQFLRATEDHDIRHFRIGR